MGRSTPDLVVGILLIVFGILLALNRIGLGSLLPFAGIALIVLGILVLMKMLPGGTLIGVVALVIGILLLGGFLDLPREIRGVLWIVNLALGIVLIILGVQRLRG